MFEVRIAEMRNKGKKVYSPIRFYIIHLCMNLRHHDINVIKRIDELCKELPEHEYTAGLYSSLMYFHSKFLAKDDKINKADYYFNRLLCCDKSFVCDPDKVLWYCRYKLDFNVNINEILAILSKFNYKKVKKDTSYVVESLFSDYFTRLKGDDLSRLYDLLYKNRFIDKLDSALFLIINKMLMENDVRKAIEIFKSCKCINIGEVDIIREIFKLEDKKETNILFESVMEEFKNLKIDKNYAYGCLIIGYLQMNNFKMVDNIVRNNGIDNVFIVSYFDLYFKKCLFFLNIELFKNNFNLLYKNLERYVEKSESFKLDDSSSLKKRDKVLAMLIL
jgi:hypothetical protein